MSLWKQKDPEHRAELRKKVLALLGQYLDDLLMICGCVCFIASAALRWGAAAGLATAGGCLILLSVLVARAGRR